MSFISKSVISSTIFFWVKHLFKWNSNKENNIIWVINTNTLLNSSDSITDSIKENKDFKRIYEKISSFIKKRQL